MQLAFDDIILDRGWGAKFKWFLIFSLALHVALLYFAVVILPGLEPARQPLKPVYTVSLMSLPPAAAVAAPNPDPVAPPKPVPAAPEPQPEPTPAAKPAPAVEPEPAELIPVGPVETKVKPEIKKIETPPPKPKPEPKKEEVKPKKTEPKKVEKKNKPPKKNTSNVVEKAVANIKAKQDQEHLEQAMAGLAARHGSGEGSEVGVRGSGPVTELDSRMRDYYLIIYKIVSSNWTLPSTGISERDKLAAIYIIRIAQSGEVIDGWFDQKSGESVFDQFVELAVQRSKLPPLPDVFQGANIEVGLRFTPAGVKRN